MTAAVAPASHLDVDLSPRQIVTLAALDGLTEPVEAMHLAWTISDAGHATTTASALGAAGQLIVAGLAASVHDGARPRYRATDRGREWIAAWRQAGGGQ